MSLQQLPRIDIIRDVSGITSTYDKDKIIREGLDPMLVRITKIPQVGDSTSRSLRNVDSTKSVHCAKYDKKKCGSIGDLQCTKYNVLVMMNLSSVSSYKKYR